MSFNILRIERQGRQAWALQDEDRAHVLDLPGTPLAALLEFGPGIQDAPRLEAIDLEQVHLLSPVTKPCSIICQGKNYLGHLLETGARPEDKTFNMIFTKASSALTDARAAIKRPAGVRLLDYEIELGLVIGKAIEGPLNITRENLREYVPAVVLANDLSARDIQIPQGQWFKGKSYRGFCPVGPWLTFLEEADYERLGELELELKVNGQRRQHGTVRQMLYPPAETLSELSGLMDLEVGDLILTGTPEGVALQAPSAALRKLAGLFLSDRGLMDLFVKKQARLPAYLQDADQITATIRTPDGSIDLGEMQLTIEG